MPQTLRGKTILVTGGARRIGRAISLCAAKAGANVIIHYSANPEHAIIAQAEVQALGVKSWVVEHNFNNLETIGDFVDETWKNQPFDLLVNNAAVFDSLTLENTTLADWQAHMAINLTAPFLISKSFAKLLPLQNDGVIVNILDWRALRPGRDHFPYTISKAALAALTKSLAISLSPRIVVNGLALGAILPPADGGNDQNILTNVPAGRWAEVSEVEEALLFLLTGPKYITGEIIHIDGGRHLV